MSGVDATMLITAMMMSVITWAVGGGQVWLGQVDTGGTQLARAGAAPLRSAQIPQSCAGCKSGGWG